MFKSIGAELCLEDHPEGASVFNSALNIFLVYSVRCVCVCAREYAGSSGEGIMWP